MNFFKVLALKSKPFFSPVRSALIYSKFFLSSSKSNSFIGSNFFKRSRFFVSSCAMIGLKKERKAIIKINNLTRSYSTTIFSTIFFDSSNSLVESGLSSISCLFPESTSVKRQ